MVRLFSGRDGAFELADGGRFDLSSVGVPSGEVVAYVDEQRVSNACLGAQPTLPCVHADHDKRVVEVRVAADAGTVRVTSDGSTAFTLRTQLVRPAPLTIRMQY